jgi:segregation and condensation protein B
MTKEIEAILMSSEIPVKTNRIAKLLEKPEKDTAITLKILEKKYSQNYGFVLKETGAGWFFYSNPKYAGIVEKNVISQNSNLSIQAMETLAIIAYKQPINRSDVSDIRGVNSDGVIRKLISYGFIKSTSDKDVDTASELLKTTDLFLEKMGLKSLNDLEKKRPHLPKDVKNIKL